MTYERTHNCGQLAAANKDEEVQLCGWVHRRRDLGGLIFVDLRDRYGMTQLVFDPEKCKDLHEIAMQLKSEWVISVKGKVVPRREGAQNKKIPLKSERIFYDGKSEEINSTLYLWTTKSFDYKNSLNSLYFVKIKIEMEANFLPVSKVRYGSHKKIKTFNYKVLAKNVIENKETNIEKI